MTPGRRTDPTRISLCSRGSAIALFLGCLTIGYTLLRPVFSDLELRLYDYRLRLGSSIEPSPAIVHVDIDDRSLEELGPWPWTRDVHARGLEALTRAGAEVVVYDIVFHSVLGAAQDGQLARAMAEHGKVVIPAGFALARDRRIVRLQLEAGDKPLMKSLLEETAEAPDVGSLLQVERSFLPAPSFSEAAFGVGHISATPDRDGVFRRLPLAIGFDGRLLPSIELSAVALYKGCRIQVMEDTVSLCREGESIAIPVDGKLNMPIRYAGSFGRAFVHLPFTRLIEALDSPGAMEDLSIMVKGKLALISLTASGSTDMGPTPLSTAEPLSMVHSNAMNTMLQGQTLRIMGPFWSASIAAGLLLVLGILWWRARPVYLLTVCVATCLGYLAFNFLAFAAWDMVFNLAAVLGVLLTASIIMLNCRMLETANDFSRQNRLLEAYFSPQVRGRLIRDTGRLFATTNEDLTVMFTDISGFSALAESMHPEAIQKLLLEYFDAMTEIIFETQGAVDKFMGDGIMAFWGFPPESPSAEQNARESARRAVRAGLAMQARLAELNLKWAAEGRPGIAVRMGAHTDYVTVGNMGSRRRMEFTLIGKAVNLAQRLEANAEPGALLISERTRWLLGDEVLVRDAGRLQVKGFEKPVQAYRVEGLQGGVPDFLFLFFPLRSVFCRQKEGRFCKNFSCPCFHIPYPT